MGDPRRSTHQRVFPEVGAGGFSRLDATVEFYSRVRALAGASAVVVDLGAGRGSFREDPVEYRRRLRTLKGDVARLIGIDVDPVVTANPTVDETYVVEQGNRLPLEDASVDLVVSDSTFEHVADPNEFTREISRVLKPGGWLCARTPNKWGYIGMGARLVPNDLHVRALRVLQPTKKEIDTFAVRYRLNTRRAIRRYFPPSEFEDLSYFVHTDPAYFADSIFAWRVMNLIDRALPPPLREILLVFVQKRPVEI